MTSIALRPRSGPELLDAAFQFWRESFTLLCTVVAAAFGPIIILEMLAVADAGNVLFLLMARIGALVFEAMASAAVIFIVSERYMGRDVTAGQALQKVASRIVTIFATSFLYGLIVGIGFMLLIVPGFYWACKYFAMMPAVVIEGLNSSTSQKRSATLTNGSKWRVLGLIVVAWIIYFVLLAIAGGIVGATMHGSMTGIVLTRLLVVPIYPFLGILVTLLYYDLRIRNEGLDLDMMLANETPVQSASA
jgi:hypothetical protein